MDDELNIPLEEIYDDVFNNDSVIKKKLNVSVFRIILSGEKKFENDEKFFDYLTVECDTIIKLKNINNSPVEIISIGNNGIINSACLYANERKYKFIIFELDSKLGKYADFFGKEKMFNYSDFALIFYNNQKNQTRNFIYTVMKKKFPCKVRYFEYHKPGYRQKERFTKLNILIKFDIIELNKKYPQYNITVLRKTLRIISEILPKMELSDILKTVTEMAITETTRNIYEIAKDFAEKIKEN